MIRMYWLMRMLLLATALLMVVGCSKSDKVENEGAKQVSISKACVAPPKATEPAPAPAPPESVDMPDNGVAVFIPGPADEANDNNPLNHEMKGDSKDFLSLLPDDSNSIKGSTGGGGGSYDCLGVGGGAGCGSAYLKGGARGGSVAAPRFSLKRKSFPPAHGGSVPPNSGSYDSTFFKSYGVNPFVDTEDEHLSTFATDIDTASYTIARAYLKDGHLPPPDAVRTEEFINYFDYNYAPPESVRSADGPAYKSKFAIHLETAPSKFGKNCYLQRIGIRGRDIAEENRKDAILTFVIDISGSMGQYDNRLELVKKSLRLLINELREGDSIGIVVYTTNARVLMQPTDISCKDSIIAAINSLHPEASTNAEDGLRLGYEMANRTFRRDCINRIILCTDGVANEGQTGAEEILKEIKPYTDKGIYLTALGFGMDNYNDVLLQKLGDKGNGHYAYIDNFKEAKRMLVDNLTGVLQVVAKDVKVQVDFNPKVVRSFRLIGYEKRDVPNEKFRDDKQDGGEIGSGFSVTALYEIKLWEDSAGKVATLYVRAKNPNNDAVKEVSREINTYEIKRNFEWASDSFKLAACAAEFAEILRQSYWAKDNKLEDVLKLAQNLGYGYRESDKVIELVDLISRAKALVPAKTTVAAREEDDDDE